MHYTLVNPQAIAQLELEEYVKRQAQEIAPELEIDAVRDENFHLLYRVWYGMSLLGSFYHDLDGAWIARTENEALATRCDSSDEAQLYIIQTSRIAA